MGRMNTTMPDVPTTPEDGAGLGGGVGALRRANTHLLIEANRAHYDAGAPERELRQLRAALSDAQADIARLQGRLHAFETSRIWRLTRPVRLAVDAVLAWRRGRPPAPERSRTAVCARPLRYDEWIAECEAACFARLVERTPANKLPPRVGLVLFGARDRAELEDLGAACPPQCSILVIAARGAVPGLDPTPPSRAHGFAGTRARHGEAVMVEAEPAVRPFAQASFAGGRLLFHAAAPGLEPADAVPAALDQLDTDMLCFVDEGARLAPGALRLLAAVLAQEPQLDLVFADEDWRDAAGQRTDPFFKPAWDWELQHGRNLAGPLACMRTALVRAARAPSGPGWLHDLTSQVAAATRPSRIHRIPAVLCHRTQVPPGHAEAVRGATAARLRREGVAAQVQPHPGNPLWSRIAYGLPRPAPPVSIIVPTKNRADLLRVCADGVLHKTDYPALELLVVDNGSTEPDALALLETLSADPRVRVIQQSGAFNWSALNNAAALRATGDVFVLLNNDIAVLQPDWLEVLVSHAVQPGVGAVGAKLLYPDGRVQHAGLTTDRTGIPRHMFRYAAADDPGVFGLLASAREVWGVTGACLAIARGVFFDVGGLNETFPIAYNDVDLCLRLTAQGYRIIWDPVVGAGASGDGDAAARPYRGAARAGAGGADAAAARLGGADADRPAFQPQCRAGR